MSEKNLKLWESVSRTNPKNAKKVSLGRTFTAISPHSQIKAATAQFGPVGEGWGWTVERVEYPPNETVAVLVRLWHGEECKFFEQWGQTGLYIDKANTKRDEDSFKKATTDAVTKCLSYLGFNADVFEGKFDDNKYVEEMEREFHKKAEKENWSGPLLKTKLKEAVKALTMDIKECTDIPSLDGLVNDNIEIVNQCKVDLPEWYHGNGGDFKGLAGLIDETSANINERTVEI